MASILSIANGVVSTLVPTESWTAPNGMFGTPDRNDGSAYGWADASSTVTLPASGLADGYLFLWGFETQDSSNGRYNPQGRMVQASGTGTFASAQTGGYSRDTSEDRAYVAGWSFVDSPSASSTYQFQWKRDTDAPNTGDGTVRAYLQVVPFYYSDIGIYTSSTAGAYGGTTPNQMTGFSAALEGTNITIASNQVTVTGDNKRYLCLGAGFLEDMGNTRTQRWFGFEIDGVFDDSAKGCMYYRSTADDEGGESFIKLLETATASRTIEMNCYRGDGVAAGQGGADVDGTASTTNAAHAMVVIELNDSAEVFASVDSVGGQEFAVAGPVDVDIASTGDIEFSDSASFTRASDIAVNCEVAADVLAFANVSHAREASSIGSGLRWTVHGEFTINGAEQTGVGFHGNYNRGNQSTQDCHGSSCNQAGVFAVAANDDIGVSNTQLAGTEGGGGDIESQAGWVGFGLINLDTLAAGGGADHDLLADDVESSSEVTAPSIGQDHDLDAADVESAAEVGSPALDHPPRVWLNSTQTKSGATEMTVTAWSETSITFTDPSGSPTGSLQLGVENTETGEIGWIAVTVNAGGPDHVLLAEDLESGSEVTNPAVGQVHGLAAADLESGSEVTSPDVGQVHGLAPANLESAAEVTNPAVGQVHDLTAADIESGAEVTTPAVSESQGLLANDVEAAAEVSSPVFGQVHNLAAADLESSAEVTTPTAAEAGHALLAEDLESGSELTSPAVGQVHSLGILDVESSAEITVPAVGQAHNLVAADIESDAELTTPALGVTASPGLIISRRNSVAFKHFIGR